MLNKLSGAALMLGALGLLFVFALPVFSQGTAGEITGYFWSETIGWVSANCSDHGTCGTSNYKLAVDQDGVVSGYAWSEHIGWVSAQAADLVGCPSSPCTIRFEDGALAGWMRALSGGTAESGGWDGFISMAGVSPAYSIANTDGILDGFAWGSDVVGWLESYAETTFEEEPPCADTAGLFCATGSNCLTPDASGSYSCERDAQCNLSAGQLCTYLCHSTYGACIPAPSPTGVLTATPSIVPSGGTTMVSWDIEDAVSCTVTSPDDSWNGLSSGTADCTQSGSACVSSPITEVTTFTLNCEGEEGTTFSATAIVNLRPAWQEI